MNKITKEKTKNNDLTAQRSLRHLRGWLVHQLGQSGAGQDFDRIGSNLGKTVQN